MVGRVRSGWRPREGEERELHRATQRPVGSIRGWVTRRPTRARLQGPLQRAAGGSGPALPLEVELDHEEAEGSKGLFTWHGQLRGSRGPMWRGWQGECGPAHLGQAVRTRCRPSVG